MISRSLFVPALAVTLAMGVAFPVAGQVTSVRSGSEKFDRDSTRPPGTAVEVRLRRGELTVRDHGPGIAADDLPLVFTPVS